MFLLKDIHLFILIIITIFFFLDTWIEWFGISNELRNETYKFCFHEGMKKKITGKIINAYTFAYEKFFPWVPSNSHVKKTPYFSIIHVHVHIVNQGNNSDIIFIASNQ
jgi:hypothetical protein